MPEGCMPLGEMMRKVMSLFVILTIPMELGCDAKREILIKYYEPRNSGVGS